MEKDVRRKIWLGLLVLSGTVIFLVGIFSIGKKENLLTRTFTVSVIFRDINGLQEGDYVYFAGDRGGIVKTIAFINDTMIKVDMKMDKRFQPLIHKNDKVYIATEGLVGNKILDIKPGSEKNVAVKEGDLLVPVNPFNTEEVLQKLFATNENTAVITQNLAKFSTNLNTKKGLVNEIINDSVAAVNFKTLFENMKNTGARLLALSEKIEKIISDVDLHKGVAGKLLHDTGMAANFEKLVKNLEEASAVSLRIAKEIETGTTKTSPKNTIQLLMRDSMFAKDLEEGVKNFRQSTDKLNKSLDALQSRKIVRRILKSQLKK